MKKLNKILLLTVAVIVCILLLPGNEVFAEKPFENMSDEQAQQEAGRYIASFASNFWNSRRNEVTYDHDLSISDGTYWRRDVDHGLTGNKLDGQYLYLECTGWCNFAVYNALHLQDSDVLDGSNGYALPLDCDYNSASFYQVTRGLSQSQVQNYAQPGDIIANRHHVMIYAGDGIIIHSDGYPLSKDNIMDYYDRNEDEAEWAIYRITPEAAKQVEDPNANGDLVNTSGGTGAIDKIKDVVDGVMVKISAWAEELMGEDNDQFKPGTRKSEEFEKSLYYKGLADKKGEKKVEKKDDNWTFFNPSAVADWVVGAITMPLRGALTGFAQIAQFGATKYVEVASGETTKIKTDVGLLDDLKNQMLNSLTLEKIVYNKVPLFDVNVFNGNKAGGQTISNTSVIASIRNLTAQWYYSLRLVAIIALLLILIYAGIKAAISTIASDKAEFKEFFVNWLVAFTIVFFMQYFLIAVLEINETLVGIFANLGKSLNLYEQVRELTWSVKLSTGIIATMLYVVLVYYLIKFIAIYLKRLFITVILIVVAPLVAGKFAYDKLKGKKDQSSLSKWVKEYVFSVIMQTTHALTYTIFVSATVDLAKVGDSDHIFATVIIAWVFLYFMVRSEKLLRDIFKLVAGNKSTSAGDATQGGVFDDLKEILGISFFWNNKARKQVKSLLYDPTKSYFSNKINNPDTLIGGIANSNIAKTAMKPLKFATHIPENFYTWYQRDRLENLYGKNALYSAYKEEGLSNSQIEEKINNAIKQEYSMRKNIAKSIMSTGLNTIFGIGKTVAGIPVMIVESPAIGIGLMVSGIDTLLTAAGKPIKGYKVPEESGLFGTFKGNGAYKKMRKIYKARGIHYLANVAGTMTGVNWILGNIIDVYDQKFDVLEHKPEEIKLMYEAREAELAMLHELNMLRDKEFKGYSDPYASEMDIKLSEKFEKQLTRSVLESQKTVPTDMIRQEVEEYKKQNGKFNLGTTDLMKIAKKLQVDDPNNPKNNITIRNEIEDNMKSVISAGVVGFITKEQLNDLNIKFDSQTVDLMANKVQAMIADLDEQEKENSDLINDEEHNRKKNALEVSKLLIEQSKEFENIKIPKEKKTYTSEEIKTEIDNNEKQENKENYSLKDILDKMNNGENVEVNISKLSQEEKQEINQILIEAVTDDAIDNAVSKLNAEEITSTIKKAVDMDGSIEKNISSRFSKVIEQAEKMREVNEKYAELKGIDMDQSGNLIEKEEKPLYKTGELLEMVRRGINSPKQHNKEDKI